MYINYFKQNYNDIKKYKYIWIIENDVYFKDSFINFITPFSLKNGTLFSKKNIIAPVKA